MTKDFSDGKNDGRKEWTKESKDRGEKRSFSDRPRFSRDNDNRSESRNEFRRDRNEYSRDRDNRNNRDGDRPRFSRDNRDSRDGRSFGRDRDNNRTRDFGNRDFENRDRFRRDERGNREDRDDRSRRDSRDFARDRVNSRENRDFRGDRDSRDSRDSRESRSFSDRPRFSRDRDSRDSKPFGDRPRFSRDSRDRDNRDGNRFERFDRPRFAKSDRNDRQERFSEERKQENRPRFDRAFRDEAPQKEVFQAQSSENFSLNESVSVPLNPTEHASESFERAPRRDSFRDSFGDTERSGGFRDGDRGGFRDAKRDGGRGGFRGSDRGGFRDSKRDSGRDSGRGGFGRSFERTDLQEVLDLDKGILKLLAKRARFLQKLVTGKMLDASTEKQIRTAWEENASKLSRDPKVFRELFLLVQSVEALSLGDTDQPFFNLSPAPKPVQVELPAPTSSRITRYYMTLAAASGKETSVKNVPLTDSMIDGLKSLNFMGGDLWYENDGTVMSRQAKGLERGADKAVHIGKDSLNLWLVLALSLGLPYHLKITGENELRSIDFMPISRFLPKLGARLVQIIPSQEGLPVRVEASGMLPEEVTLPADLPRDFVFALLLASTFWESDIRFNMTEYFAMLAENPLLQREWDIMFEELDDVLKACEVDVNLEDTSEGMCFICRKSENAPSFAQEIPVPSDAEICTTFFLLPAFTSGYVQLSGVWTHRGSQKMIKEIMDFVGLEWTEFDGSARVKGASDTPITLLENGEIPHCPAHISTLLYTVCAERGLELDLEKLFTHLPQMPHMMPLAEEADIAKEAPETLAMNGEENKEADQTPSHTETASENSSSAENNTTKATTVDLRDIILSFLSHIGYNEKMQKVEVDNSAWLAPSAAWAVAFSLGAYIRPRLKLVNPNILNDYYPFYWRMYNTLPNPELKKQERKHDKVPSSRKRVIAQGVYADLADVPQPNPDADADGY